MLYDVEVVGWRPGRLRAAGWWRNDTTTRRLRRAEDRAADLRERGADVRVIDRTGRVVVERVRPVGGSRW